MFPPKPDIRTYGQKDIIYHRLASLLEIKEEYTFKFDIFCLYKNQKLDKRMKINKYRVDEHKILQNTI